MFIYNLKHLKIIDNKQSVTSIDKSKVLPKLEKLLLDFEDLIHSTLEKKKNSNGFKYVLSQLNRGAFDKLCKTQLSDENLNVFLFTQHINYIGDKIINVFANYGQSYECNYIITFEGSFGNVMMNSSVCSANIIEQFEILLENFYLKNELDIVFIEITGSDKLKFEQCNLGAKIKRYNLK